MYIKLMKCSQNPDALRGLSTALHIDTKRAQSKILETLSWIKVKERKPKGLLTMAELSCMAMTSYTKTHRQKHTHTHAHPLYYHPTHTCCKQCADKK